MVNIPLFPISRLNSLFRWLFVAVTFTVLLLLAYLPISNFKLESDLQALLPQDNQHPLVTQANEQLYKQFGNKILLAVQAPELTEVKRAAELLAVSITENALLQSSFADESLQQAQEQQELLARYRYSLLTLQQQHLISRKQNSDLLSHAQAALFGFNTNNNNLSPLDDPLSLFPAYAQQLQPAINGEFIDGRLLVSDTQGHLILFPLNLRGETFSLALQQQMSVWLQQVRNRLTSTPETANVQLLMSGAVFHAAAASASAQHEMTVIGVGSILGILLLYLLSFRRFKPLLLSISSIVYGCICALVVTHTLFGELHVMTLVFGASLIGVAIDYSLHYLCKLQALYVTTASPVKSVLENLLPALSLGLLTSVLGYSCLLQTALPGLQQIACFSVVGLICAWLFVVTIYPLLLRTALPPSLGLIDVCAFAAWNFWGKIRVAIRYSLLAGLLLMVLLGAKDIQLSSDVRTLYKPSAELMTSEQRLQQVLQAVSPNQYFLLRAKNPESLLQTEEKFRREHLEPLVAAGALSGYTSTSAIVPSQQQQLDNYQLLRDHLYADDKVVSQFMRSAGFDEQAIIRAHQHFGAAAQQQLQIADWLQVARPDQRLLWLGKLGDDYVSIIGLRGVTDVAALAAEANQNSVIWINRVANMSTLLQHLMSVAAVFLLFAYGVIMLLLWIVYRRWQALLLVLVPFVASITTLALLSLCGIAINVFHIFGCYLILGLGMDYSIFSYIEGAKDKVSQRAIWLSAMTSALSFGLLALSSTPMVNAFGITLLLGCGLNLLLAPLVGELSNKSSAELNNNVAT